MIQAASDHDIEVRFLVPLLDHHRSNSALRSKVSEATASLMTPKQWYEPRNFCHGKPSSLDESEWKSSVFEVILIYPLAQRSLR